MLRRMWILGTILLVPVSVAAEPCESDADCEPGYACAMSACASCPPGEECNDEGCGEGECVPLYNEEPKVQTNLECESDADCPSFFACEQVEIPCAVSGGAAPACTCPDCDPDDDDCPPCDCGEFDAEEDGGGGVPEECEPQVISACTLTLTECETDTDCADGWACQAEEVCSGGGSAGCACACECPACEPGAECPDCTCDEECECPDEPQEFEETCETVGAWCAPKEVECSADSDCPEEWTCEEIAAGTSCSCGTCACSSDEPDCECPPCDCSESEETVSYCLPGGWRDLVEGDAVVNVSGPMGEDASGGSGGASGGGQAETGSLFDSFLGGDKDTGGTPEDPGSPNGEGGNGGEGGSDEGGTAGTGDDASGGGGCAATGHAGANGWLLTLAGLALFFVRRRQ